jgi:hypothetical protein
VVNSCPKTKCVSTYHWQARLPNENHYFQNPTRHRSFARNDATDGNVSLAITQDGSRVAVLLGDQIYISCFSGATNETVEGKGPMALTKHNLASIFQSSIRVSMPTQTLNPRHPANAAVECLAFLGNNLLVGGAETIYVYNLVNPHPQFSEKISPTGDSGPNYMRQVATYHDPANLANAQVAWTTDTGLHFKIRGKGYGIRSPSLFVSFSPKGAYFVYISFPISRCQPRIVVRNIDGLQDPEQSWIWSCDLKESPLAIAFPRDRMVIAVSEDRVTARMY